MTSTLYIADLYSAETVRDDIAIRVRFDAQKKTLGKAMALIMLFGFLGAHRFYVGRMGSGAAMLSLTAMSMAGRGTVFSSCGLAIVGMWGLIDAFRLPKLIATYNCNLRISLGH